MACTKVLKGIVRNFGHKTYFPTQPVCWRRFQDIPFSSSSGRVAAAMASASQRF